LICTVFPQLFSEVFYMAPTNSIVYLKAVGQVLKYSIVERLNGIREGARLNSRYFDAQSHLALGI
jgi:hypothetical protein